MKNIHVLPTDKPSRLYLGNNGNFVFGMIKTSIQSKNDSFTNQNLYITSDEEIKEGDWCYRDSGIVFKMTKELLEYYISIKDTDTHKRYKIILTTNQDLIADGVQAINDNFLEWFVKNPSCEEVEIDLFPKFSNKLYGIIIPKEEPKQETLEEAADKWVFETNGHRWSNNNNEAGDNFGSFIAGAKWQAKRMHSEEEVLEIIRQYALEEHLITSSKPDIWFEQFKNK